MLLIPGHQLDHVNHDLASTGTYHRSGDPLRSVDRKASAGCNELKEAHAILERLLTGLAHRSKNTDFRLDTCRKLDSNNRVEQLLLQAFCQHQTNFFNRLSRNLQLTEEGVGNLSIGWNNNIAAELRLLKDENLNRIAGADFVRTLAAGLRRRLCLYARCREAKRDAKSKCSVRG